MADLNKIIVSGVLTEDPVVTTNDNGMIVRFPIIIRRPTDGSMADDLNVELFGKKAEMYADELTAGMSVFAIGRVRRDSAKDQPVNFRLQAQELIPCEILSEYDGNKVVLVGRLTADPEVRYTTNGKAFASFTLAINRPRGKQADFITIVCWEKLAEIVGNNLTKGRKISVEGRYQRRLYKKNDDSTGVAYEIVAQDIGFLDYKNDNGERSHSCDTFPEDEIPF